MQKLLVCAIYVAMCCLSFPAFSADVFKLSATSGGPTNAIVIEGRIQKGDYKEYINLLKKHPESSGVLVLYSPGGDLEEAIKIGNLVREIGISTSTALKGPYGKIRGSNAKDESNNLCASSCFFIWAAGVSRGGNVIGLHRPYIADGGIPLPNEMNKFYKKLKNMSEKYAEKMDFDTKYVDVMFSTPSTDVHWIEPFDELKAMEGYIPSMYEYLYAICENSMPRGEIGRFNALEAMGAKYPDKPFNKILNDAQLAEWKALNPKYNELQDCMLVMSRMNHREQLQKFLTN